MEIKELQQNWNELGKRDPLWAILSDPEKINRQWDLGEFFTTGEEQIAGVLRYVEALGLRPPRKRALDFGCGVGRLTQALCRHFEACCGVDIAPSMIALAQQYNRHGGRCTYFLNDADDLSLFGADSFDFVCTFLVLQHMRPEYSKSYLREFVRVLAPGGVLVFQLPAEVKVPVLPGAETLPESAFRALLTPQQSAITAEAASYASVGVTVRNVSDVTWPVHATSPNYLPVLLGGRWLDESGAPVSEDHGRAALPHELKPGEEVQLHFTASTPAEPGRYVLELDMVQEAVAWFRDRGSRPAQVRVNVEGTAAAANGAAVPGEAGKLVPQIEMYGVPRDEVLEILTAAGGSVVDVKEDNSGGPEWLSFNYCVTKR
jgi:SAM-dependent methyltransferase